jgi:hypothetical protein
VSHRKDERATRSRYAFELAKNRQQFEDIVEHERAEDLVDRVIIDPMERITQISFDDFDRQPCATRSRDRDHFRRNVKCADPTAIPCEIGAAKAGTAPGVQHGHSRHIADQFQASWALI